MIFLGDHFEINCELHMNLFIYLFFKFQDFVIDFLIYEFFYFTLRWSKLINLPKLEKLLKVSVESLGTLVGRVPYYRTLYTTSRVSCHKGSFCTGMH